MPVASGSWCSRRSSRPPAACLRPPSQQPEPLCPAVLTLLNAGWNLCKLFVIKLALRGETSDESTDARRERHQPTWIWAHHFHLVVGGPRASRHQCPDQSKLATPLHNKTAGSLEYLRTFGTRQPRYLQFTIALQKATSGQGAAGTPMEPQAAFGGCSAGATFTEGRHSALAGRLQSGQVRSGQIFY